MPKIIGIDLGTSNSAAAAFISGKPTIIPSAEGMSIGGKMFPSYVAFTKDGQILIGEPARRQAVSNPDRTIMAIKRKMGTDHKVNIEGKDYTPQDISAMILRKIKEDSEAFLGDTVNKAVITVPAYFNDNQRAATKDAGRIAGLEVLRLINEPTAASLAYGLDKKDKELKICVLDLGGGTFDVTIMEMGEGVFQVKSTDGDTQLGGTDMDRRIIDWMVAEFKKDQGIDVTKDSMAIQRIREAAEKAKIELSTTLETSINLPYITADESGPKHLTMTLSRSKLEQIVEPVLDRLDGPINRAFDGTDVSRSDIDNIILVGGPTRMPCVRKKFSEIFGREAERGIDPMECVAMGAAIQAGVMAGDTEELVLLDVTPLSLGVETLGNVFTRLIERNTTIPTEKSQIFSTAADNQPAVEIHVLQGERQMAAHNVTLGTFHLVGIPPAPRGVPQIKVKFDIDVNGILNVSAEDLGTGKSQAITITASTKLSDEEIEEKIKEAEKHAADDKIRREKVEAKNSAEQMVYQTEKLMKEHEAKLDKDLKEKIEKGIEEVKKALESDDTEKIKKSMEDLESSLHAFSQKIYQDATAQQAAQQAYQQASPTGPGPDAPSASKVPADEEAVDVEYEIDD